MRQQSQPLCFQAVKFAITCMFLEVGFFLLSDWETFWWADVYLLSWHVVFLWAVTILGDNWCELLCTGWADAHTPPACSAGKLLPSGAEDWRQQSHWKRVPSFSISYVFFPFLECTVNSVTHTILHCTFFLDTFPALGFYNPRRAHFLSIILQHSIATRD